MSTPSTVVSSEGEHTEETMIEDIIKLPPNFYPDCWSDDLRMSVLFAPFRAKELNIINYTSKQKFWRNLISKYCETKGSAQVTLPELRIAFQRNGKKTYALETVLNEMETDGEIVKTIKFMEEPQHTWRDWAHRSMTKIVSWPVYQVKSRLWNTNQEQTVEQGCSIVLRSVVKLHADLLQRKLSSITDRVVNLETVYIQPTGLTQDGIDLAIHELGCSKRAALANHTSTDGEQLTLLKIAGPNKQTAPITDEEKNIFNLNLSWAKKSHQIEVLEEQVQELDKQVRQLVREKKSNLAKLKLRQKKSLEAQIEKLTSILLNIEKMISSIADSKQSSEILATYRLASNTLKNAYAESGITPDSVDDAVADVKESLDDHAEVQDILNNASNMQLGDFNDSELEKELAELLQDDETERDQKLDESIERRLHDLKISGFSELSIDEQRQIIGDSVGSLDELLKIKVGEKRGELHSNAM